MTGGRYVQIPMQIFEDHALNVYERTMFCAIASFDWRKHGRPVGDRCVASLKTLAYLCGTKETRARASIKKLVDLGYVTREERVDEDGLHHPNRLAIVWKKFAESDAEVANENGPSGADTHNHDEPPF